MHSRNSSPRPFNKVHTKVSEQIPMLSTAPLPHGKFEIGGHAAAPVSLSGGRARISGTKTDGASGDLMTEREQLKMGGTDERFRGTRVGEAALTGASEKEDEEARAGSKAVGGMAGYGSAYGQALEPEAEEPEEGEIRPDEEEQECQGTLGGRAAVLGGGGRKVEQSKVSWTARC